MDTNGDGPLGWVGAIDADGNIWFDEAWSSPRVWLPDFSDPATLGCLRAQVKEKWGANSFTERARQGADWCWEFWSDPENRIPARAPYISAPTELGTLLKALAAEMEW